MKILKILGIALGLIALIVFVAYFLVPDSVHMERSIVIDAPAEKIFDKVNTFNGFNEWSPWAKIDPETKYSYEGPESGVGAKMTWTSGHPEVGNGTQEIIESVENSKVTNLMIFEGFTGKSTATILLEEQGAQTKVTWTYDASGISGIPRFFMLAMDGMLGPFYEQGLADLKIYIESTP